VVPDWTDVIVTLWEAKTPATKASLVTEAPVRSLLEVIWTVPVKLATVLLY
jgi:hypothetical protein